jgi:hypothetical protein
MSRKTYALIAVLLLASFAIPFTPSVTYVDHAFLVMLGCSGLMSAAFLFLLWKQARTTEKLRVEVNAKTTHFVQAIAQSSIYFYVALWYDGPARWAMFIVYQLFAAYVFDFLLSAFRHNRYKLGFNIFPIVLSINLFMWFKPEFFVGQLLMIFSAILAKAYIVRKIEGRPVHIFNPSALPMAVTAVAIVLLLNAEFMLSTNNIVASYLVPTHMQLFVFAVGMLSHLAAGISFVSMGAVVTLVAFDAIFRAITGLPPMGDVIHPSVFIGITLLVTDPVTSPKTRHGQLIYGSLYGLGIIAGYMMLQRAGFPTYYDKILPVPILNFIAPYIDRIKVPVVGVFKHPVWKRNWAPSAVYAAVFLALLPMIEKNFMRRTYFIENREQALSASQTKASGEGALLTRRPERREPIDPELGALIQKRIVNACQDDPTVGACWLLRRS